MTTSMHKSDMKQAPIRKDKTIKTKTILKTGMKRKGPKHRIKFAGTIQGMFIEPKGEYYRSVWCAIGVGFAHMCIGATNFGVLHYSVSNGDTHATVCCLAFHFFSAEAILSLNYANAWSTPMRLRHRKFAHIFLQICGVTCAITGTLLVILADKTHFNLHGLTGILAAVLAVISVISGIITLLGTKSWLVIFHMSFGMPTFVLSSISLCSGLLTKPFTDWAGGSTVYIMIAFVVFYTAVIVGSSFLKCMSRV